MAVLLPVKKSFLISEKQNYDSSRTSLHFFTDQ